MLTYIGMVVNKNNSNPIFTKNCYTWNQKLRIRKFNYPSLSPNISSFSLISDDIPLPPTSCVATYLWRKQPLPPQPYHFYELTMVTHLYLTLIFFLSISMKHHQIWVDLVQVLLHQLSKLIFDLKKICFHHIVVV